MFSYLIPKLLMHIDIVEMSADGNPGTTNAMKYGGKRIGLLCLLSDLIKGFLPVFVACHFLDITHPLFAFVLAAPVLGHATAPFLKIKGGKSIAVSFGVLAGICPHSYLLFLLSFWYILFSTIIVIYPHEIRTIITYFFFAVTALLFSIQFGETSFGIGACLCSAIVIHKHKNGEISAPEYRDGNIKISAFGKFSREIKRYQPFLTATHISA